MPRAVLSDDEKHPQRPNKDGLHYRQLLFIEEYCDSLNAAQAAKKAGYNHSSEAFRLLKNPLVKSLIEKKLKDKQLRTQISADDALIYHFRHSRAELPLLARNGACRCCYGIDHQYQFTLNEYREAMQKHQSQMLAKPPRNRVPFDEKGGIGFDPYKPPVAECPECWGRGKDYPMLAHEIEAVLTPEQRTLFNGITFNKRDGSVRFDFQDRMDHAKMAYTLAALIRPVKAIEKLNPAEMTDDQLEEAVRNAREQGLLQTDTPAEPLPGDPPGPIIDAEPVPEEEPTTTDRVG